MTFCLGKFGQEKTNCWRETGAWLLLRRCFPQACTRNWRATWNWARSTGSPKKRQWRLWLSWLSTAAGLRRGALSLWLKKSTGTKSEYTKRSSDHMGEWRSLFLQFTCSGKEGWSTCPCYNHILAGTRTLCPSSRQSSFSLSWLTWSRHYQHQTF